MLSLAEKVSSRVRTESEIYEYDMFFLRIYNRQLQILYTVLELCIIGRYVESFILLRSVFESFFLTLLMSR